MITKRSFVLRGSCFCEKYNTSTLLPSEKIENCLITSPITEGRYTVKPLA